MEEKLKASFNQEATRFSPVGLGLPGDAGFEDGVCDCNQPSGDGDDDQLMGFPAYFESCLSFLTRSQLLRISHGAVLQTNPLIAL